MSLDYFFVCLDCKEEISFKWGMCDAFRYAFEYEDSSKEYGKSRLKMAVDFLEKHETELGSNHRIVYMDEHSYFSDRLFREFGLKRDEISESTT